MSNVIAFPRSGISPINVDRLVEELTAVDIYFRALAGRRESIIAAIRRLLVPDEGAEKTERAAGRAQGDPSWRLIAKKITPVLSPARHWIERRAHLPRCRRTSGSADGGGEGARSARYRGL